MYIYLFSYVVKGTSSTTDIYLVVIVNVISRPQGHILWCGFMTLLLEPFCAIFNTFTLYTHLLLPMVESEKLAKTWLYVQNVLSSFQASCWRPSATEQPVFKLSTYHLWTRIVFSWQALRKHLRLTSQWQWWQADPQAALFYWQYS